MICVPKLSITDSKVKWSLCSVFNSLHGITNEEQQVNPVTTEIRMVPIYKRTEAMHHATMNQHLGLSAKWNGTQRKTKVRKPMMRALYVLWYAKRHISGRSNVEQDFLATKTQTSMIANIQYYHIV